MHLPHAFFVFCALSCTMHSIRARENLQDVSYRTLLSGLPLRGRGNVCMLCFATSKCHTCARAYSVSPHSNNPCATTTGAAAIPSNNFVEKLNGYKVRYFTMVDEQVIDRSIKRREPTM